MNWKAEPEIKSATDTEALYGKFLMTSIFQKIDQIAFSSASKTLARSRYDGRCR